MTHTQALGGRLAFGRPEGWRLVEPKDEAGIRYHAQLIRPRTEGEPLSSSISLMVLPVSRPSAPVTPAQSAFEDALGESRGFRGFKVLETKTRRLARQRAQQALVQYEWSLPLYSPKATSVRVQEQLVSFQADDSIYVIRFTDTAQAFPQYQAIFEQFLSSIRIS
jgi:hypothetical protein